MHDVFTEKKYFYFYCQYMELIQSVDSQQQAFFEEFRALEPKYKALVRDMVKKYGKNSMEAECARVIYSFTKSSGILGYILPDSTDVNVNCFLVVDYDMGLRFSGLKTLEFLKNNYKFANLVKQVSKVKKPVLNSYYTDLLGSSKSSPHFLVEQPGTKRKAALKSLVNFSPKDATFEANDSVVFVVYTDKSVKKVLSVPVEDIITVSPLTTNISYDIKRQITYGGPSINHGLFKTSHSNKFSTIGDKLFVNLDAITGGKIKAVIDFDIFYAYMAAGIRVVFLKQVAKKMKEPLYLATSCEFDGTAEFNRVCFSAPKLPLFKLHVYTPIFVNLFLNDGPNNDSVLEVYADRFTYGDNKKIKSIVAKYVEKEFRASKTPSRSSRR